jgi:hypothetical protein
LRILSRRGRFLVALAVFAASAFGCGTDDGSNGASAYPLDDTLRLNQVQVLGSHNSFHIRPQGRLGGSY